MEHILGKSHDSFRNNIIVVMTKIFAIVVTYNGMTWVDRCLSSLCSSKLPVSVVVVDNDSSDGTPDYIEKLFPEIKLIRSNINYGFAKANNIGIRYALDEGAEYIFLLNQDAWILPNTVEALTSCAERNPDGGIFSPIHFNGSGTGLDAHFAGYLSRECVSDIFFHKEKTEYSVPFVNAAAWLLRRECVNRVGGFDTSLFQHYGEDVNYTQRVNYHGYKVYVCMNCFIFHDREERNVDEANYRSSVFSQEDNDRKKHLGNITLDIDSNIDRLIANNKRQIRRSTIKLRLRNRNKLLKESAFLRLVKDSREKNKIGGLVWL